MVLVQAVKTMSPIRTRAQNRRKSGASPPPFPPASARKTQQPLMASATRSSNVKKTARRRKSFKIEVLADRTSSLNVAEQKKLRRKTSFHPETVPLIKATPSPLDETKKAPQVSAQVDEKRRRRASRTPRPSLHVHWAENLRRVVSISPSQSTTSVLQRGQVCPYMRLADGSTTYWSDLTHICVRTPGRASVRAATLHPTSLPGRLAGRAAPV